MRTLAITAFLLFLGAATAAPPPEAQAREGAYFELATWLGDAQGEPWSEMRASMGYLWFSARVNSTAVANGTFSNTTPRWYIDVNFSSTTFIVGGSFRFPLETDPSFNLSSNWTDHRTTVDAVPSTGGEFWFNASLIAVGMENTTVIETIAGSGHVAGAVAAPTPLIPTPYLVGGAAVLLVAIAIGAYTVRERRIRARMRGQARSQVMREMELEKKLEKVEEKHPEQAAAIKQEIRQQEVVREKRRELQILEAKRSDVLKTMDLLKKRHSMGALSKLQYDNMVAKRQAELAKIEAEIADMERQDAGASAA